MATRFDMPGARRRRASGELHVLCMLGDRLLAWPAAQTERLLTLDDARLELPGAGVSLPENGRAAPFAGPALLFGPGGLSVAWDLAALLGEAAPVAAWLTLRLQDGETELRMAVGLTRCLAVERLGTPVSTPPGLWTARPGAISSVFIASPTLAGRSPGRLGVAVHPARLWTSEERAAARHLLATHEAHATEPA